MLPLMLELVPPGMSVDIADSRKTTILHLAARKGVDIEVIRKLVVQYKMNVNVVHDSGNTPLHVAALHKNVEAITLLV